MSLTRAAKRTGGWKRYNVRLEGNGTIRVTRVDSGRQFGARLTSYVCHPAEAVTLSRVAIDWVIRHYDCWHPPGGFLPPDARLHTRARVKRQERIRW